MADDAAILQMIRVLPMVDALYDEAFRLANSGGGFAPDYFVKRLNAYVQKIAGVAGDDFLGGLELNPEETATNEQKMEQVSAATAELRAYLRQRIGVNVGGHGGPNISMGPHYTGCHFAAGVPPEEGKEEEE